jgi:ABC-type multidrug transport system fused ATPase/permease subunit
MVRGPSEFVARLVRDTAELQRGLIALVSKAVASVLKGLAALIVAMALDLRLTLIAAPTAIIVVVVLRKLGKRIRRGTRGSLKAQEGLLRISTEVLQGLRALKTSTAEMEAMDRFAQSNEEALRHELKVRTARSLSAPVIETLAIFVVLILAAIAARGIQSQSIPLDRFILVLTALGVAGGSLRPLTGLVNDIQASSAPAERIDDVLNEPREGAGDSTRPALPRHRVSIEFDRVSYTYPGADQLALREISLNILHGERVAIVGPNGSGKTTLLSLVPRLLVPDSGRVAIDGADLAATSLASLRNQIGVVTQETVLFRGSIAKNIALGQPEATRQHIMNAAVKAHADSFIRAIPGGYDADILEQGASLSGGQRQRLAIARAVLRDPAILLLDEATSQMDADSEAHIQAAMREFCAGRTTLVIAHRLATVVDADRIVVMDCGRIVDQGRHADLLKRCALYQALTRTQLVGAA